MKSKFEVGYAIKDKTIGRGSMNGTILRVKIGQVLLFRVVAVDGEDSSSSENMRTTLFLTKMWKIVYMFHVVELLLRYIPKL